MRDLIRQKIVDALITLVPAFYAGPCNGGRCQFSQFPPTSLGAATDEPWLALRAACGAVGIGNGLPTVPFSPVTDEQCQTIVTILHRHTLLGMALLAGQRGYRLCSPGILLHCFLCYKLGTPPHSRKPQLIRRNRRQGYANLPVSSIRNSKSLPPHRPTTWYRPCSHAQFQSPRKK